MLDQPKTLLQQYNGKRIKGAIMKPLVKKMLIDALSAFALAAILATAMYGCMQSEEQWLLEQDAIQYEKRQIEQVYIAPADRFLIEIKEGRDE